MYSLKAKAKYRKILIKIASVQFGTHTYSINSIITNTVNTPIMRWVRNALYGNLILTYKPGKFVGLSMESVYYVVWKPRHKNNFENTNHIFRTALYGDQAKIKYKLFLLNLIKKKN